MKQRLHSQIFGDGFPLIILHGLFGSSSNWRSIGKRLSNQYQIHLLDLRNHGHSFWSEEMSYFAMAQDVVGYLDNKQISSAHILGHSMGGKAAMMLALTQPSRVQALLVADIAPIAYQHDHSGLIDAMQSLPLDKISTRGEADKVMAKTVTEPAVRQFLLQNLIFNPSESNQDTPKWRINLNVLNQQMPTLFDFPASDQLDMSVYSGLTIFIRGETSDYVTKRHEATIKRLFPDHHIETISQAGHWLHAEQPKQFIQVVTQFLSQIPSQILSSNLIRD